MNDWENASLRPMDLQLTVNYTSLDLGMPIGERDLLAAGSALRFHGLQHFAQAAGPDPAPPRPRLSLPVSRHTRPPAAPGVKLALDCRFLGL
jgi:hypothetical protein